MNPLTADSINNSFSPGKFLQENKDNIYVWIKNNNGVGLENMMKDITMSGNEVAKACTVSIAVLIAYEMSDSTVLNQQLLSAVKIISATTFLFNFCVSFIQLCYLKTR